jgi:hypothetical protein
MWLLLKYYLFQFSNYRKNLPFRIKIEISALLIIFYVYGTEKLVYILRSVSDHSATGFGLSAFLQHVLLMPAMISLPFIYFNLFPRQRNLKVLRPFPLTPVASATLLILHLVKYQLVYLILLFPLLTAVLVALGPWPAIYLVIPLLILPSVVLVCLHALAGRYPSRFKILIIYFISILAYFSLFAVFYFTDGIHIIFYQSAVVLGLILALYHGGSGPWEQWDTILYRFSALINRSGVKSGIVNYSSIGRYIPLSLRPILTREILIQIRNHKYLRLKILSLLFFVLGTLLGRFYAAENFRHFFTVLVVALIWWHYSSHFNEKYVQSEPEYFLRTMPWSYRHFVISKILNETIYVVILTLLVFSVFLITGVSGKEILISVITLFSVAVFVLFTTIIFKLIFYDNPRLAGYAYHFMILFCLVMTVNFYFLGPLITVGLLIYFTLKSYQVFKH